MLIGIAFTVDLSNYTLHYASLKPLCSFEYLRIDNLAYYRLYIDIKDIRMQGVMVEHGGQ